MGFQNEYLEHVRILNTQYGPESVVPDTQMKGCKVVSWQHKNWRTLMVHERLRSHMAKNNPVQVYGDCPDVRIISFWNRASQYLYAPIPRKS